MTEPRNPAPPDDSAYGVLRIKAGPGGGAVRLATLVRDLMERHQMARAEAVLSHLLPPLHEPNAPALYLLQPGGNASAHTPHFSHFDFCHPVLALRVGQRGEVTHTIKHRVLLGQVVCKLRQGLGLTEASADRQARPLPDAVAHGLPHGRGTAV